MKRLVNIIDEEMNTGEYEIFCTFDSDITNKSYVIFTERCKDKTGNVLMRAGSYVKEGEVLKVDKRLTDEEYEMISTIIQDLIDEVKNSDN